MLRTYDITNQALQKRFWAKVPDQPGVDCWEWAASLNSNGCGQLSAGRGLAPLKAHRLAYEFCRGSVPDGFFVCHACDNPGCVNPGHLFLGSHQDNMNDAVKKNRWPNGRKTACVRGHPFDAANTARYGRMRICLTCRRHRDQLRTERRA